MEIGRKSAANPQSNVSKYTSLPDCLPHFTRLTGRQVTPFHLSQLQTSRTQGETTAAFLQEEWVVVKNGSLLGVGASLEDRPGSREYPQSCLSMLDAGQRPTPSGSRPTLGCPRRDGLWIQLPTSPDSEQGSSFPFALPPTATGGVMAWSCGKRTSWPLSKPAPEGWGGPASCSSI